MSLNDIRAALAVIAEHQAFVEKTKTAFPPAGDDEAEVVGYINLRQFGVQFSEYVNWKARTVHARRTWFTKWESARIVNALTAVSETQSRAAVAADEATTAAATVGDAQVATAEAATARNISSAALRLIRQHRFAWLRAIDACLSGLKTQRVLNRAETDALRLAIRIAGETALATEVQLKDDFNATAAGIETVDGSSAPTRGTRG